MQLNHIPGGIVFRLACLLGFPELVTGLYRVIAIKGGHPNYPIHSSLVNRAGFEPATCDLKGRYSSLTELPVGARGASGNRTRDLSAAKPNVLPLNYRTHKVADHSSLFRFLPEAFDAGATCTITYFPPELSCFHSRPGTSPFATDSTDSDQTAACIYFRLRTAFGWAFPPVYRSGPDGHWTYLLELPDLCWRSSAVRQVTTRLLPDILELPSWRRAEDSNPCASLRPDRVQTGFLTWRGTLQELDAGFKPATPGSVSPMTQHQVTSSTGD